MRVIVKQMPGDRRPPEWRMNFSQAAGDRGVDYTVKGSSEDLRLFLTDKLEIDPAKVSFIIAQSESYGLSHFEVDLKADELRTLVKQVAKEAKEQAARTTEAVTK